MKSRTKVVVIGGGIASCSTLDHLTEEGWSDVVLTERDELTSGTTWRSAAQITNCGMNQTMVGLKSHSIQLYKKLRVDGAGYGGRVRGVRLISTKSLLGGLWDGEDADIVVNACGHCVNEMAEIMGVHHLVASMEHQYLVTEDIPAIAKAGHRMPLLRCPISDYCSGQEKNDFLVRFYEQDCKTWGMNRISHSFANDLCPIDLNRVMDVLKGAFERMPALTDVGIKRVVNGFNRIEITGADRHTFLVRMICGAVLKSDGRVGLGYLLNHSGRLKAEAIIANLPASDRGSGTPRQRRQSFTTWTG